MRLRMLMAEGWLTRRAWTQANRWGGSVRLVAGLFGVYLLGMMTPRSLAQGTTFTYQGVLSQNGMPAQGQFDFVFVVYDTPVNPVPLVSGVPVDGVPVNNGQFTVQIQFLPNPFNGQPRWIETVVRPSGVGEFVALAPRQPILPTPYAILAGSVPDGAITGAKLAAGSVNAASLSANSIDGSKIVNGSIGSNDLAPGVIGNIQLAKPYLSGRLSLEDKQEIPLVRVPFTFTFPQPFSKTPTVALGLKVEDLVQDQSYRATLNAVSPTGFAATVYTPVPEPAPSYAVLDTIRGGNLMGVSNLVGVAFVSADPSKSLVFSRSPDASAWADTTVVVNNRTLSGPISVIEVSGRPAISYYDVQLQRLRYVRANDALGKSWGSPVTIASNTNRNASSLIISARRPAIVFNDEGTDSLKFVRANDELGTSWGAPVVVATNPPTGRPVMATIRGIPCVGFQSQLAQIFFVSATSESGAAWGKPTFVLGPQFEEPYLSLVDAGGVPAIGFVREGFTYDFRYLRATSPEGTNWTGASSLNRLLSRQSANHAVLGICDGRPYAVWSSRGEGGVFLSLAVDVAGNGWTEPVQLSSKGGIAPMVAVANRRMTIGHWEGSAGNWGLKVIHALPSFDLNWFAAEQ